MGTIAQLLELRVSDPKFADPAFDFRTGNSLLCSWKRLFTIISHRGLAVNPLNGPA